MNTTLSLEPSSNLSLRSQLKLTFFLTFSCISLLILKHVDCPSLGIQVRYFGVYSLVPNIRGGLNNRVGRNLPQDLLNG